MTLEAGEMEIGEGDTYRTIEAFNSMLRVSSSFRVSFIIEEERRHDWCEREPEKEGFFQFSL